MRRPRIELAIGATSAGLLVLLGLAYVLSPWMYASSIESAVRTGDLALLARHIDAGGMSASATDVQELLPAGYKLGSTATLEEELRKKINESIKQTVGNDPAFIQKLANLLGGRGMVTQELIDRVPKEWMSSRTAQFSSESGPTMDTYMIRVAFRETGEQVTLVLQRRGWFTWRAAKLAASSGSALWPLRAPRGV